MKRRLAVCLLLLAAAPALAADLSKIDRRIKKEPAYKNKPKYCLLVFGSNAETKVWLVLDGDVFYVDTNGDGDLTEKGKAVRPDTVRDITTPGVAFRQTRVFRTGPITRRRGKAPPVRLRMVQFVPKRDLSGVSKENEPIKAQILKTPDVPWVNVAMLVDGKARQRAGPAFGNRPQEAPVIHFDGPLTFQLEAGLRLVRGDQATDLRAALGTPGLGRAADGFAERSYQGVPAGAHPVAELQFPNCKRDGRPIVVRVVLDQRC
jgi:hypothetical protein